MDCALVIPGHHRVLLDVHGPIIEATIEFVPRLIGTALLNINKAGLEDFTDASGPLTLQPHNRFLLGPVDEVRTASIAAVAHVAERDLGVIRLLRRVVVTIEVVVNEQL